MRKTILVLAFCGFAASLWAVEPIVGTWKTNASQSKLAPVGDWVKEIMVTYREVGDQLTFEAKGTLINGTSLSNKGNRPLVGGIIKRQPPDAEGIIYYVTVIGPGDAYVTWSKEWETNHSGALCR